MGFLRRGSINRNLGLLVLLAVLPALLILLQSGMEQRRAAIGKARRDVQLLAHSMAEVQGDLTTATRQILATLAQLPEIQGLDPELSGEILAAVLEQHPVYVNNALSLPDGRVLASGKPAPTASLADRRHFREAVAKRGFVAGEYIVTRSGSREAAFPFAYPVIDREGKVKGVLTVVIGLARFASFHDVSELPEKSFVAVTDARGIRLFYYPPRESNPVGRPIRAEVWDRVRTIRGAGMITDRGSDGVRRILAFEPLRLAPDAPPYLYVWAGVPEELVLAPANAVLRRNLLLLLTAAAAALLVAWLVGRRTLVAPIENLVALSRQYAAGNLDARGGQASQPDEFALLTAAFHDMAGALARSRQTIQENEARFRLLTDSLNALVYVADMDTYEILFINDYGRNIHGDITGAICWQTLQKGQDGPCSFCTNKYLLRADNTPAGIHTWEFRNTISGRYYFIQDRAIRWVDGRLVRLEVATDISERRLAETRLAEESERLAVTLRSIGEGVITTDTEDRVVLVNRVAEILTGWETAEAAGRPLAEVFRVLDGESRLPCTPAADRESVADALPSRQMVLVARDGRERTIAGCSAPIRDREGNILGSVFVFRDITTQLRTEQELLKVKKLESVGVLAGGIAHDFNNIMTAVRGNIDLALIAAELSPATRQLLEEAGRAVFRAQGLTRQLLTFAKGGAPIRETAALAEVVRDSAEFVLRGGTVACRYVLPEDLWLVDIDRGQISQVIQNIILNGAQAMPQGGTITVSCENAAPEFLAHLPLPPGKPYVKMCIADTGAGIPADIIDRVFDPYFSTREGGSGLGLAITHSIVSKHGGHIEVASTPGSGTTFTVYLPASRKPCPAAATGEDTAPPPVCGGKILVMDDEEQVRALCKAMLAQMGHQAVLAADGLEALELYRQELERGEPFDLVLMDLTVPGGMGGREAVGKLLAFAPEARVVVTSGYSSDPIMAEFRAHGFRAALEKPFSFSGLQQVLSRAMV
ncbi:MAG: ATP-binding protein [Thermodesulfobacteriota bacterium]